jgi:hypothetical protein
MQSDKLSYRIKLLNADPEWHRKVSDGVHRAHIDGKFKNKSAIVKDRWKTNPKSFNISQSPERSEHISSSLKKHYKVKANRDRTSTISKKLWKDPAYRVRRAISLAKSCSTNEYKLKLSNASKKMWSDPNYRRKIQQSASQNTTSILEDLAFNLIKQLDPSSEQWFKHGGWTFDIYSPMMNTLIEINGDYFHSKPETLNRDKIKKDYFNKNLANKFNLEYINEYEFYAIGKLKDRINKIFKITNSPLLDFELSNVDVKMCTDISSKTFLSKYHYLSKYRYGVHIGAFLNSELIAVAVFSPITRQETANRLKLSSNEIMELSRLCIHPQRHKLNFASWFIAHATKLLKSTKELKALITFADTTLGHDGTIYKAANWQYDGDTKPTYWYIDNNGHYYHKKSIWDQASRLKMTENAYAEKFRLIKINGKKLLRFIKKL